VRVVTQLVALFFTFGLQWTVPVAANHRFLPFRAYPTSFGACERVHAVIWGGIPSRSRARRGTEAPAGVDLMDGPHG
jgi:hypothetical protein